MEKIKISGKEYTLDATFADVEEITKKYDLTTVTSWEKGKYADFVFDALFLFIKSDGFFKPFRSADAIRKKINFGGEFKRAEEALINILSGEDKETGNGPQSVK